MESFSFTRQFHNFIWIHGMIVYFGHIWHTAVTNFYGVSVENYSLWDLRKCLFISPRKMFATIVDAALLYGGLKQVMFQNLFFGFCRWFLVYLKSTLNPLFFRASLYFDCAVLNISSLAEFFDWLISQSSLGGIRNCFITFSGWFDKLWM